MGLMRLPMGYKPISLSLMLQKYANIAPTLGRLLFRHLGMPEEKAAERIVELEALSLVQFAIAPNGEPSCFIAPSSEDFNPYPSPDHVALAEKLITFWDIQGKHNDGQIISAEVPLSAFQHNAFGKMPHWQIALDQKIEAMKSLQDIKQLTPTELAARRVDYMDLQEDLNALKVSEVFSFNADTMHAIMEGAKSIPPDSPLSSVEIPTARAGWFWFAEPYPVASSPVSAGTTAALLWSWHTNQKEPALQFSAYVVDQQVMKGRILPSTKWSWPVRFTLDEMLAMSTQLYRETYTGKGKYANNPWAVGEHATMEVVQKLSRFFMMSCLWFRQTVPGTKKKIEPKLTQEQGHIERHARKRFEKEFNLKPTVRVIALRKTQATAVEPLEAGTGRKLKVRFIVKGHAKLQPCGPGRSDRKLIWVDAYPMGPDDAPFKESGPKVFAVIR
jgi:hypothetical protein